MPPTTAIFKKNPVSSSPMRGGGKRKQLYSADGLKITWDIPEVDGKLNYESANIVISNQKNEALYTYSSEGNTQLNRLPTGLKERIVSDYVALATAPAPETPSGPVQTTIFSEDAEGVQVEVVKTTGSLDIRAKDGVIYYISPAGQIRDTETAALEQARYLVGFYSRDSVAVDVHEYKGITITIQAYFENIRDQKAEGTAKKVEYIMTGEPLQFVQKRTFTSGEEVAGFGTLNGDQAHDLAILDAYIDDLTTAPESEPTEEYRYVPIAFKGWEDAFSMANTPFASGSKIEESDVAGDQIAMEKNTGLFGMGSRYSAVNLYVKQGYKVVIDVDIQGLEKSGPGDKDVAFEAQLLGGDAFVLDFVSRNAPSVLSVLLNGKESSPYIPEDTSFEIVDASATIVLVNIYKRELVESTEPVDDDRDVIDDDEEDGDITPSAFGGLGMVALGAAVLLLFFGLMGRLGKKAATSSEGASDE